VSGEAPLPTWAGERRGGAFYMSPCPFAVAEAFPGGYGIRPYT